MSKRILLVALLSFGFPPAFPASAADLEQVDALLKAGQAKEAIDLLVKEVEENPAHEAARVRLAEAYEKAGMEEEALTTWEQILSLSKNEDHLRQARRAVAKIRRVQLDRLDAAPPAEGSGPRKDPFKIDMPEIDWTGLEVVEDSKYLPPILPPPTGFEVPPFISETEHFTVYSTNERLSRLVGERAELYLEFMNQKLFGGRSWAARVPILIYQDLNDYYQHGGPQGSGGVTMGHVTGRTEVVILFQLKPDFSPGQRKGGSRGAGKEVWKYGIESVLPHELTHAVLNEFFAGGRPPRWIHEAIAGRFEQTRDHYGEAARLGRSVVGGEYFRMRDLFEQTEYPERIGLFYEQAACVVLFLFESGPEAMHAFLSELAAGNDHDAACAAALGIPEEGAVEEFERRWVEWMRLRYIKDLDREAENKNVATAGRGKDKVFQPWANEMDTVSGIENWRDVDLSSMSAFMGVGPSLKEWSVEGGKLKCRTSGEGGASVLGIRMNEVAPAVVQCTVELVGAPGEGKNVFGFTQLDAEGDDTRIEAAAPLADSAPHTVTAIWGDDLAIYVDGKCMGRYPARNVSGNERDIDFPLAFVAYGPVDVQNVKVAPITAFSDKPIVAQAEEPKPGDRNRNTRRGRRSRTNEP